MLAFLRSTLPCRESTARRSLCTSFVLSFIVFATVVIINNNALGNTIVESKCDPTLFSKPYVILQESKNGPEISKLETQGVLDLRHEIHRYICINGPVILYAEVSVEEDTDTPGGGVTTRYSHGTFKLFNHKCMSINRMSKSEIGKLNRLGIQPHIDSSVQVIGMKATGIFLVASDQPYDPTYVLKVMLNQVGFGYATGHSESIISDASFIAVGKGPYCLKLKDGSTVVLSSAATDDNDICRWSLKDNEFPNKNYKRAFQSESDKAEFKWEDCPSDIMSTAPTPDPAKPPPVPGTGGRFSMINPAKFTPHGSRRGGKPSGGDDWPPSDMDDSLLNNACSLNPGDPTCDQEPDFPTVDEEPEDPTAPLGNIFYTLENSEQLPKFDAADPICDLLKKTDPTFDKLTIAMELDEDPASTTKLLTLHANENLKWKNDVLQILARIFSKICPPIRKQSVFQLMRIIDNYIATAHTADPDTSEYSSLVSMSYTWEILISRLKNCEASNSIVPMEWEWLISDRKKRDVNLDNIDELLKQLDEEDTRPKPMIARSSPVFSNDKDNEAKSDFVFASIPRWKRTSPSPMDDIVLPWIQEYFPPTPSDDNDKDTMSKYESFIFHPKSEDLRIKDYPDQEIFYYEDVIVEVLDLNPAIDAWWKIFASVIGYCQLNEQPRANEIFPTLFHSFDEYFFKLIKDKWTKAEGDLTELEMVLGEFLDEDRAKWLDTCLETAYILSDSLHFRPARPLYFENSTGSLQVNHFVETPENYEEEGVPPKYFMKKKLLFK